MCLRHKLLRAASNIDGAKVAQVTASPLLLNRQGSQNTQTTELLTSEADAESKSDQDEARDDQLDGVGQQSAPPAFVQVVLC